MSAAEGSVCSRHRSKDQRCSDVHFEQIAPRCPAPGKKKFLETNQQPQSEDLSPAKDVLRAIWAAASPFWSSLSVTNAKEIPARKRNNGAGSVPPICDHMKNFA